MEYPDALPKYQYIVKNICKVLSSLEKEGFTNTQSLRLFRLYMGERLNVYMQPSGFYLSDDFNKLAVQLKCKSPHELLKDIRRSKLFLIAEDFENSYLCAGFASPLYVDVKPIKSLMQDTHLPLDAIILKPAPSLEIMKKYVVLPGQDQSIAMAAINGGEPKKPLRTEQSLFLEQEVNKFLNKGLADEIAANVSVRLLQLHAEKYPRLRRLISTMDEKLADDIAFEFVNVDVREHLQGQNGHFLKISSHQRLTWLRNIYTGRFFVQKLIRCIERMVREDKIP